MMITKISKYLRDFIFDKYMRFQYLNKIGAYRFLSDTKWVKKWYYLKTGNEIDLENPKTFHEKMQWYKINYHDPAMPLLADKNAVRQYVESKGLQKLLKEQYGVYDRFGDIDFQKMPDVFYLKTNHGSGANEIIRKKDTRQIAKARRFFDAQLRKNYYWKYREWAYKDITPKLICEDYLGGTGDDPLVDLNLFCFYGKVRMIYYNVNLADQEGKHSDGKRAVFDENMNYIKGAKTQMEVLPEEECIGPSDMEEIIRYAECLAADFPHVRVDFFYIRQKVYFGEMTFYSAGGDMHLEPPELLEKLNQYFDIDKIREQTNLRND